MFSRTGHLLKTSLRTGLALVVTFFFLGCGKIGDPVPRDMAAPPAIADRTAPAENQAASSISCGVESTPTGMGN